MATFLMLGKYSPEAMKGMSAGRTKKTHSIVKKFGGEMQSMYALLGEYDLAFFASYPGISEAMKASVALSKATNISFTTSPATTIEEFDKLIEGT